MSEQPTTFEGQTLPSPDEPLYDQGLQFDVGILFSRQRFVPVGHTISTSRPIDHLARFFPRPGQSVAVLVRAGF